MAARGRPTLAVEIATSDPGAGSPRTLTPLPALNEGFHEDKTYLIAKPAPRWTLRIDDEPLADGPDPERDAWTWKPQFYAGEVVAELLDPDLRLVDRYRLDVGPNPGKLGRDLFQQMVDEIRAADPALVLGTEPATDPIGSLNAHEDPWLDFWRLREFGPRAVAALRPIRERPRRGLVPYRQPLPPHQVTRIDRQTVRAALRNPAALVLFDRGELVSEDLRIDTPRAEETFDTAANRCLLAILRRLAQRAKYLLGRLEQEVAGEEDGAVRTMLAVRWPARREFLVSLIRALRSALRERPFPDVSRAEISAAGLNAIAYDPAYSRAYNLAWRALRRGVAGPQTAERTWMSPTWEIYERWCFVAVSGLLREKLPSYQWSRSRTKWGALLSGVSPDGRRTLELELQPRFPSRRPDAAGRRRSVSKTRKPDLVLTATVDGHARFWIFDAKYRTARHNVLDAMTSAHVYQDSLRLDGERPQGSWLLIPRGGETPWLEDPSFQEENRVGVQEVTPGRSVAVPQLLRGVLDDN